MKKSMLFAALVGFGCSVAHAGEYVRDGAITPVLSVTAAGYSAISNGGGVPDRNPDPNEFASYKYKWTWERDPQIPNDGPQTFFIDALASGNLPECVAKSDDGREVSSSAGVILSALAENSYAHMAYSIGALDTVAAEEANFGAGGNLVGQFTPEVEVSLSAGASIYIQGAGNGSVGTVTAQMISVDGY